MDNKQKQEKSIPLIAFLVVQAIFIVVIVSIILMNTTNNEIEMADYNRQPTVSIKDISSQLPDAPTSYTGTIEQILAKTIALNLEDYSIKGSDAIIRDGSLKTIQFDQIGSVYYTMIVDIPDLQQSYQIFALYPLDVEEPNPATYSTRLVLCLDDYSEKIYPDFNCKDLFGPDARQSIISNYFEYFGFDHFTVLIDSEDSNLVDINPVNFNIDDATKGQYIQEVKNAIDSLGIAPDTFTYRVLRQSDLNYYIPPEYR